MRQTKQAKIDDLERTVRELRELRAGDVSFMAATKNELQMVKAENDTLRSDKAWLKQMHSSVLQATSEMFRKR